MALRSSGASLAAECKSGDQGQMWESLGRACAIGDAKEVDKLVSADRLFSLNARFEFGMKALHIACMQGHALIVKRLLAAGADPAAVDDYGASCLVLATRGNHADVVSVLLSGDCSGLVNKPDSHGQTALLLASKMGYTDIASLLVLAGAAVDVHSKFHGTPLMCASAKGHIEVVKMLLCGGRCNDLEAVDANGRTALYIASWRGHVAVVKSLIAAGASMTTMNHSGTTALAAACRDGHLNVVELFLGSGRPVHIDAVDDAGETALHQAAVQMHLAIVLALLAAGADTSIASHDGLTAMNTASFGPNVNITRALLEHGSYGNIEATMPVSACTALWIAADRGDGDMVSCLLHAGANPNTQDRLGNSVLGLASQRGSVSAVDALLCIGDGADAEMVESNYRRTPLHLASQYGNVGVVERLLFAGVNTLALDITGQTALDLASSAGRTMIRHDQVAALLEEADRSSPREFRAKRIWPRRKTVLTWRVCINYA